MGIMSVPFVEGAQTRSLCVVMNTEYLLKLLLLLKQKYNYLGYLYIFVNGTGKPRKLFPETSMLSPFFDL